MWCTSKCWVVWLVFSLIVQTASAQIENLVLNPSFEEDEILEEQAILDQWGTWGFANGLNGSVEFDDTESIDGSRSLKVDPQGADNWHYIVVYINLSLDDGQEHTTSFWAKAESPRNLTFALKAIDNSVTWGITNIELTTEWTEYSFTAEAENADAKLEIWSGGSDVSFWLDFVWIYEGEYVEVTPPSGTVPPVKAADPVPAADANDVPRDVTLSWTPGLYAATHDVYFGTVFEDVNDADTSSPLLVSQGQDVNEYDLGRLEFGETYHWRIDEVNAAPDDTVYKGNVWSFTVEPYAILIPGSVITATASSSNNQNTGPERTIDGSGISLEGTHSTSDEDMWLSAAQDTTPWLQYEFDTVYLLDEMRVWNYNTQTEPAIGWGIKDVQIETSVDGTDWTLLPDVNQFSRAFGTSDYGPGEVIKFGAVPAKYVRMTILNNWGGLLAQYGLSEVRFYAIPVSARSPNPLSGALDVPPSVVASWRAGRQGDQHVVYVDTDPNTVAVGTAPSATTTDNFYDLSSFDLLLGETYHWKVNEVNDTESPSEWDGPIWTFSTPLYLIVDDFERYGNDSPDRPFQTWIDGLGYTADDFLPGNPGNGSGAAVGHDIWSTGSPHFDGEIMEQSVVHGGAQSMPLYYDNTGTGGKASYSEITRTFDSPQDWTQGGIETLVLFFHGTAGSSGQFYVKINNVKIEYTRDPVAIGSGLWTQWNIDLSTVNTDPTTIVSLSVGIDGTDAAGLLLLDDVLLYRSAPAVPIATDPGTDALVAHWSLDDGAGSTVTDTSIYQATGNIVGSPQWVAGYTGQALRFFGSDYIDCGTGAQFDLTEQITLSAWVMTDDSGNSEHNPFVGKGDQAYAIKHGSNNSIEFYIYDDTWYTLQHSVESTFNLGWHHIAGTYDGAQLKLYMDGALMGALDHAGQIATNTFPVNIGRNSENTDRYYEGTIDDVRIYNRTLSLDEIRYIAGDR